MSLVSIVFSQFADKSLLLQGVSREIFLDATIAERPNFSAQLTTNPVENGSLITDHVIDNPDTLTIDGLISDTRVRILSGIQDILEAGFGSTTRSRSAFDLLKQLKESKTIITIVSGLTLYTDMIITSFTPNRTSVTGKALRFNMQLQKIIKVSSKVIEFDPVTMSDVHAGSTDQIQSATEAGKQPTKIPSTKSAADVSIARQLFNAATGGS